MNNILMMSDAYKYGMWTQYPPGTTNVYSYVESRGGRHDHVVFFGLQAFLKEYLEGPVVTREKIDEAERYVTRAGLPFNREGWERVLSRHQGRLPVVIKAVEEGTVVGTSQVLLTVENTDPDCYWLTTFLETALLRAVWYPTTIASNGLATKRLIRSYLRQTGDESGIDFKLHDFGARGVSSHGSAQVGGAAHLVNFMGTDTMEALPWIERHYGGVDAGFSIPAMEHSTVTSWGREGEVDSFRNMVKTSHGHSMFACVSDSYDIFKACESWGTVLRDDVLDSGATLVVRPDSGDPLEVLPRCMETLSRHFGYDTNHKGFKILRGVRLIWGDGIGHDDIDRILAKVTFDRWSADNLAFGMGGGLLQAVTRDDQKFACKASFAIIANKEVMIQKDPITDPGKRSKMGKFKLIKDNNVFETINHTDERYNHCKDYLQTVFENGILYNETTFDEIRVRALL